MIKNLPLVSIGIPVVKTKYLKKAIRCCQVQTYSNIEIVILNNARTPEVRDEIEKIVKSFNDLRIRYYRNEEQLPIIDNWNKVFDLTEGKLFSLLSDDDEYKPEFVQSLFDLSVEYPLINVFHCRVLINNEINNTTSISPTCPESEDVLDFVYHRLKGCRTQYLSDFMVRSNTFKELGGFVYLPDGWGSDTITWFKIAQVGGVAYSSKFNFTYNNNTESITNSGTIKNKIESISIYCDHIKTIASNTIVLDEEHQIKQKSILEYLPIYAKNKYYRLIRQKSMFRLPFKIGEVLFLIYMTISSKRVLNRYR